MNYREIMLANGKIVTLEDFKMEFVYDGILLGTPDKDVNNRIISDVIKSYNSNKVFVIMDNAYVSKDRLKPILFSAQLVAEPINDMKGIYHGSYLNIVWFANDFKTNSIETMIENLKWFDWDTEAENYQF